MTINLNHFLFLLSLGLFYAIPYGHVIDMYCVLYHLKHAILLLGNDWRNIGRWQ